MADDFLARPLMQQSISQLKIQSSSNMPAEFSVLLLPERKEVGVFSLNMERQHRGRF